MLQGPPYLGGFPVGYPLSTSSAIHIPVASPDRHAGEVGFASQQGKL